VLAEELDADWSKVRPVKPSGLGREDLRQSGIFLFPFIRWPAWPRAATSRRCERPARRRDGVLLDAVAAKWKRAGQRALSTEPSMVVHTASGRRIGYGDIAAFAKSSDRITEN